MSHVLYMCPKDGTPHGDIASPYCKVCGGGLRFYCATHREWLFGQTCPKCGESGATALAMAILNEVEATLDRPLRTEGNLALLVAPRRALLISRVARNSTPATPWVRDIIDSTTQAIRAGETLVVGANRLPWHLALWMCKQQNGSAILVGDPSGAPPEILPKDVLFIRAKPKLPALNKEQQLLLRDRLVGLLSTCAYAIGIRPGGNMEHVCAELRKRDVAVEEWLCASESPIVSPDRELAPSRGYLPPISFGDRLTHFTREPQGLWPGETPAEHLAWLSSGPDFIPRDAFQTLRRILTQQKLRACGRLILDHAPMACFTQRDPAELLGINRWRKGLQRRMYTPYAISFLREDLARFGVRPVRYIPREVFDQFSKDERPFLQIESSAGIKWISEAEWRIRGDVDFSTINPDRVVVLTAHDHEAWQLERDFGVQARVMSR